MFLSIDTEPARGPRMPDGSLPDIDLLKPVAGSFLVNGGVGIGEPFYGSAPDIGAYDYVDGDLVPPGVHRGSGTVIADLTVYDVENAGFWEIRSDLKIGDEAYGDGGHTISGIPENVQAKEWVNTSIDSRAKNYLFTSAELVINEDAHVLIAHSDLVSNKPEWLSDYEMTDLEIIVAHPQDGDFPLTIYEKHVQAGDTVRLGRNSKDGSSGAPMYLVLVGNLVPVFAEGMADIAAAFALNQNYPNPFNAATTITYNIPRNEHVSIKIYDVTGRELVDLVNENLQAGSHSVVWNADSFPSGVYHYRMFAGDYSVSKTLIFVR